MNWDPTSVINAGISLLALESEHAMEVEMTTASTKKKELYNMFMKLSELIPGLQESADWDLVHHRLEHHKSAAKTEDNRTFKVSLPQWQAWNPPLSCESKLGRGLSHPECTRLLCPIDVDWDCKVARNKFQVELDPPMTATRWPAFLYENYKADLNNLAKGFMRSDIMVRATRAVLFPPSVANAKDRPDHKSNRKSKATIYEMDQITPGLLAYMAVGIRYALSSETTFNLCGGVFNYQRFYTDLVAYLTDPACKRETDKLIQWWNDCLFPLKHVVEDDTLSDMLSRLRAQVQAGDQQHLWSDNIDE
ncbi:hypothetical protein CTheo_8971 [Ceratobasidium theobromae]|uniref:Uncharacterized protein n=1 Tax=Ceratobasidium theobromae TaxID=1582974 RepID=A0A5N5Q6Z9_9AGAM|nr:hypothetical protein CTheo_8971 [Ceratobasidium theobromae]